MSLTSGLHAFVSDPTSLAWDPPQMKAQGFDHLIIHVLAHENPVPTHGSAVSLRDRARAAGMGAYCWQTLHDGMDPHACAGAMLAQAPHWDGLVPNMEAVLPSDAAATYANLLYSEPHGKPVGVSTLATFELSAAARTFEQQMAVVLPQAYELENGHTPASTRSFLVDRPPIYIGWRYWCDFQHLPGRPLRRCYCESQESPVTYVLKEGPNRWQLDELSRRVYNRKTSKWVGTLRGIWLLPKVAPTVRTTPMSDGDYLTADVLLNDFREARFIDGSLPDRGGIYLAETTQDPDEWWSP